MVFWQSEGNGTILQNLAGGGGVAASLHTYVFRPDGVAGDRIFTTWPETWAAASADSDPLRRIVIDTTDTTWAEAEIPAGTWNMAGIPLYIDDDRPGGTVPYIYVLDGATLPGLTTISASNFTLEGRQCQGAWLLYYGSTGPMTTFTSSTTVNLIGISVYPDNPPTAPLFRFENCGAVEINIVAGYTSWGSFWFQDSNSIALQVFDDLLDGINWNPYIEPGAFQGAGAGSRSILLYLMDPGVSRFWLYPQYWTSFGYGITSVRVEPFFRVDASAIGASFELVTGLQVGVAGRMVFTFAAGTVADELVVIPGMSNPWVELEITDIQLILTTPGSAGATAQVWLSHNGGTGLYARMSELWAADVAAGRYRDTSIYLPLTQGFTRAVKLVRGVSGDFAGKLIIDFMGKKG